MASCHLQTIWIFDSGCSQHMTHLREEFSDYRSHARGEVSGVGNAKVKIQGVGTVVKDCVYQGKSIRVTLSNVLHVPDLKVNLISISQLLNLGASMCLEPKSWRVTRDNKTIEATPYGNLFVLQTEGLAVQALVAYSISPKMRVWHERMGHLSENNLVRMKEMVDGMDEVQHFCTCEFCVRGRMKEVPHHGKLRQGEYTGDVIHVDICGPFHITGYRGERYWITLIDGHSRLSGSLAIKQRTDCWTFIKSFVLHLESHEPQRRRCRVIHPDGAWEFDAKPFHLWAAERGTSIIDSTTEQHQSNGMAESFNIAIRNKLLPTLIGSSIPWIYWPEVLETVVYLRNRSPHTGLSKTPFEMVYNQRPNIRNLKTIGTYAWHKLPNQGHKKMSESSVRCKVLGFVGNTTYRLLHPDGKVFNSMNVHFEADRASIRKNYIDSHTQVQAHELPEPPQTPRTHQTLPEPLQTLRKHQTHQTQTPTHPTVLIDDEPPPKRLRFGSISNASPPPSAPSRTSTPPTSILKKPATPLATPSATSLPVPGHPELRYPLRNKASQFPPHLFALYSEVLALAAQVYNPQEPLTVPEARASAEWEQWKAAMTDEYDSLIENNTWSLGPAPSHANVLSGKWVFKLKRGANNEILRYKARWVVRGFEQIEGVDYFETFASVVKPMSYKALFAIAAATDYEIHQMDVKTAFLYGAVSEDIYVQQPTGLGCDQRTCKLQKALYGLKQAPRVWFQTLSDFLASLGYKAIASDNGIFALNGETFIAIYVDDLLLVGPDMTKINSLKKALHGRFKMTDLGECSYYLGIRIHRDRQARTIHLDQVGYVDKILTKFDMTGCSTVRIPMEAGNRLKKHDPDYICGAMERTKYQSMVGVLMYLMLGTRPDIAFAVSCVSRYASNPDASHFSAVQRIFRYLKGTRTLSLCYKGDLRPLSGYTDADWGGDPDTRRSTSGYVFDVGSGVISWSSKRQQTVALSSCEAEYVGQTQATKEAIWLQNLFKELTNNTSGATTIASDNQGAIALAKNPGNHGKSKHIDIQQHFVREMVEAGKIELVFVPTDLMIADGLTKPLPKAMFEKFREALGLVPSPLMEKELTG